MVSKCCGASVYIMWHAFGGKRWHCFKCHQSCEVVSCDSHVGSAKKDSENITTESKE